MLKEEQGKFKALVENALVGICVIGDDEKFAYVNKRFADIFGYTPDELIGKSAYFIVHPKNYKKVKEIIRKHLKEIIKSLGYEFTGVKKNGVEIEVATQNTRVEYEGKTLIEGVLTDVTEPRQAREKAKHLYLILQTIRKVNQLIVREKNKLKLLQSICNILIKVRPYKVVWISLVDEKTKHIIPVAQSGFKKGYLKSLKDSSTFIWPDEKAIKTGKPYVMENILKDPKFKPWRKEAIRKEYLSSVAIPLISKEKVFGAINVCSDRKEFFEKEEVTFLLEIGSDIAYALGLLELERERNKLQENLSRSFESMARTIIKIFAERDPYTAKHSKRVAKFARLITREMGLSRTQIRGIWIGGILHDVGKIGIPETILVKPGKLFPQEIALIHTHPERGYNILKDMDFPWPVDKMALQHHERLDGTGYPKGIKDDDILLEARILAVCDVLEAMPSHRPYRPAKSQEETLREIKRGRGTKYDPKVVDAAIKLIKERKIRLGEEKV